MLVFKFSSLTFSPQGWPGVLTYLIICNKEIWTFVFCLVFTGHRQTHTRARAHTHTNTHTVYLAPSEV